MKTAAVLAVLFASAPAHAFLASTEYEARSWDGGGDGRAFTGARRWRGYSCVVCHVPASSPPRLVLSSDPPELLTDRTYEPGVRYIVEVEIFPEALLPAEAWDGMTPQGNGFGAELVGGDGQPAGVISGCTEGIPCRGPGDVRDTCDPDLCDEGEPPTTPSVQRVAEGTAVVSQAMETTSWSFSWIAPEAGAGDVTLHVAGLDGDSDRDLTGDAIAVAKLEIHEAGGDRSAASVFWIGLSPLALRFRRRR